MPMLTTLLLATAAPDPLLHQAVRDAIEDEIEYGLDATVDRDIERYMETVPADYRIVEDDGSITDRETLRRNQLRAWAIIPRTNALRVTIDRLELGCGGECARVWTDQHWDRQMIGRDGRSQHNVVTTQRHEERWELRGSRWLQTYIVELGGTVTVDGQPYGS